MLEDKYTCIGLSELNYVFSVHPYLSSLTGGPGVYAILRKNASSYIPLYIGCADDFNLKLDIHYRRNHFEKYEATHVGIMIEPIRSFGEFIKNDLIASLKPTCNVGDNVYL